MPFRKRTQIWYVFTPLLDSLLSDMLTSWVAPQQKARSVIAEQEEQAITTQLLKRLEDLKKDKEKLLVQVEQEEEYLTNTLQQKLTQVASPSLQPLHSNRKVAPVGEGGDGEPIGARRGVSHQQVTEATAGDPCRERVRLPFSQPLTADNWAVML